MLPVELKLIPQPDDTQSHRCSAFVWLAAPKGENRSVQKQLLDQIAQITSDDRLRGGSLYLLPRSRSEIIAQGIVWIANDRDDPVPCPVGAIALRRAVASVDLWIPWFSTLAPNIDLQVLAKKLADRPLAQVWLPSLGLVGFAREDRLKTSDWLVPNWRDHPAEPWKTPVDVWTPPTRLSELSMLTPPTADSFLQDVRDEIGLPSQSLMDTDAGGEGHQASLGRRIKSWLLGKLDKMSKEPAPAKETALHGRAEEEAAAGSAGAAIGAGLGKLAAGLTAPAAALMSRMMQGERDRQIEKLLNMMSVNPDQALKYAIPLGNIGEAFRGFSMPGVALLARLTDFSLSGLFGGGGGPVDLWAIDQRLQIRLQQKYREQANRELATGRNRRAAYIFAHLLGDFRAAATALTSGKFFAEAAVLYRDKLGDRPMAAKCLAQGGMYREAVELYVSMKQFEEAGKVWLEAGEAEKARELFWNAYNIELTRGAYVSAANLLNDRLDERDRAIELLCDQWPTGSDVVQACELGIRWLGEDGRHEDTLALLQRMSETAGDDRRADLAHLAAYAAKSYPDHRVRIAAEDHCRLAVARSLKAAAPVERGAVLATLGHLVPSDRQLRRDAMAYQQPKERKRPAPTPAVPEVRPNELTRLPPVVLPQDGAYLDFRVTNNQLYAIALVDRQITLIQATDLHECNNLRVARCDLLPFSDSLDVGDALIGRVISADANTNMVEVFAPMEELGGSISLPSLTSSSAIGILPQDLKRTHAMAVDRNDRWWITEEPGHLGALVLRDANGRTYDLTENAFALSHDEPIRYTLELADGVPLIARGGSVFSLRGDRLVHLCTSAGHIWELSASLPHTLARVAIAHSRGLDLVRLDGGDMLHVCRDRPYQHCLWAPGGKLLAHSDQRLHCFEIRGDKVTRIADVAIPHHAEIIKLMRLIPGTIGIGYADGHIERYRLPR